MIQLTQLNKYYGQHHVLQHIDLHLAPGRSYGIVGENGAGKTTLFRCIAGLESYQGSISPDPCQLKQQLGFLPTEPYLFDKITGREYLRLLCQARGRKAQDLDQRNVFELPLDQYASTYSTGMKKKLALMGVLLQENTVLLLDEPFNGVDIQSNLLIAEILQHLRDLGKTLLVASHIFSTLADTCDELLLLRQGRIQRHVLPPDFAMLEQEMKQSSVQGKVQQLGLR